jgi:group I intron endonuclease
MIIYKATNSLNGKSYIGQTIYDIEFRKNSHLSEAQRDNLPFHNALLKYKQYFKWTILEKCKSKSELDEMEFHYIKQYNTLMPDGYNLTLGGEGSHGRITSEKTKQKIGSANKGRIKSKSERNHRRQLMKKLWADPNSVFNTKEYRNKLRVGCSIGNMGKTLSKDHKQKIGDSVRGIKRTEKFKRNVSKRQMGKNNSFYGKTHDPETIKNKMTHVGVNNPFYGKTHSKKTLEKKSKNLYTITHISGKKENVKVFSIWCKEHNIKCNNASYYMNKNKFYKGYKFEKNKIK